jgi:TP901 family phage tail tape measure protein
MARTPEIDVLLNLIPSKPGKAKDLVKAQLNNMFSEVAPPDDLFAAISKRGELSVQQIAKARKAALKEVDSLEKSMSAKLGGDKTNKALQDIQALQAALRTLTNIKPIKGEQFDKLLGSSLTPETFKKMSVEQQRSARLMLGDLQQQVAAYKQIERLATSIGDTRTASKMNAYAAPLQQTLAVNRPITNLAKAEKTAIQETETAKAASVKRTQTMQQSANNATLKENLKNIRTEADAEIAADRQVAAERKRLESQQQATLRRVFNQKAGNDLIAGGALDAPEQLTRSQLANVKRALRADYKTSSDLAASAQNSAERDKHLAAASQATQKLVELDNKLAAVYRANSENVRDDARKRAEAIRQVGVDGKAGSNAEGEAIYRRSGVVGLQPHEVQPVRGFLNSQISDTKTALGAAIRTGDVQGAEAYRQSLAKLRQELQGLKQAQAQVGAETSKLSSLFSNFARYALGYGALYQLTGAFSAAAKEIVLFDKQMANLQAVSEATNDQMAAVGASIKNLASSSSFSMNELAEGAKILAQAGVAAEELGGALAATEKFARATETAMATSANLLTTYRSVYTEMSDNSIADQLTKAVNISKLSGEDLNTILSLGASTAKDNNVNSQQLLSAVATLRNVGIKPSTAATGLRQSMLELFNLDDKAVSALQERYADLGQSLSQAAIREMYSGFTKSDNPLLAAVTELKRIGFGGEGKDILGRAFDIRATNVLSALVQNIDQLAASEKELTFGGAAAQAAETQMKSLSAQLQQLKNQFIELGQEATGGLVEGLKSAVGVASDLLTKMQAISKESARKGDGGVTGAAAGAGVAAAALTFSKTGGLSLPARLAASVAGGFAGAGASTVASNAGVSSDTINAVSSIAGIVTMFQGLKGLGGLASKVGGVAKSGAPTINGLFRVMSWFGEMRIALSSFSGILNLFRTSPVGMITTVVTGAYSLYKLYKNSDEAANAAKRREEGRTKAEQLTKDAAGAAAKYRESSEKAEQYRFSGDGGAAAEGQFAQSVEHFRKEISDVGILYSQYLGGLGDSAKEIQGLLSQLATAGTQAEKEAVLAEIKRVAPAAQALTMREAEELAASQRQVQDSVTGFLNSMRTTLAQLNDKANSSDEATRQEGVNLLALIDQVPNLTKIIANPENFSPAEVEAAMTDYANKMGEYLKTGSVDLSQAYAASTQSAIQTAVNAIDTSNSEAQVYAAVMQLTAGLNLLGLSTVEKVNAMRQALNAAKAELDAKEEAAKNGPNIFGKLTDFLGYTTNVEVLNKDVAQSRVNYGFMETSLQKQEASLQREESEKRARKEAEQKARESSAMSATADKKVREDLISRVRYLSPSDAEKLENAFLNIDRESTAYSGQKASKSREFVSDQYHRFASDIKPKEPTINYEPTDSEITRSGELQVGISQASRKAGGDLAKAEAQQKELNALEVTWQERRVEEAKAALSKLQEGDKGYSEANKKLQDAKVKLEDVRADGEQKLISLAEKGASRAESAAKKVESEQNKALKATLKLAETELKGVSQRAASAAKRGDVGTLNALQDNYAAAQAKVRDAFIAEKRAQGASEDDIKAAVDAREDLSVALLRQSAVLSGLTQAWAKEDKAFESREKRGPTTGNLTEDAIMQANGVDYTKGQKLDALEGNLAAFSEHEAAIKSRTAVQIKGINDEIAKKEQLAQTEETLSEIRSLQQEAAEVEEAQTNKLLDLDKERAEVQAKMYQLTTDFREQLMSGFDPKALSADLANSSNDVKNYGKTVRSQLVGAWESVGDAIGDALVDGEDFGATMKKLVHELARDFLKLNLRTGMNQLGQALLGGEEGKEGAESSKGGGFNVGSIVSSGMGMLKNLFSSDPSNNKNTSGGGFLSSIGGMFNSALDWLGLGSSEGGSGNVQTFPVDTGTGLSGAADNPLSSALGGLGSAIGGGNTGVMNVSAGVVNVSGGAAGGVLDAVTGGGDKKGGGLFDSVTEFFSSSGPLAKGFESLFGAGGSISGMFSSLMSSFSGGGGGGGSGIGSMVGDMVSGLGKSLSSAASSAGGWGSMISSFFSAAAANGGVIRGFSRGGWVDGPSTGGGVIRGPGSGVSDSILAFGVGRNGSAPIKVSNGEAILTAKATSLLGKDFIDGVNSGKIAAHASGRFALEAKSASRDMSSGLSRISLTGGSNNVQPIVKNNITNVLDPSVTKDYVTSRAGSKEIVNKMQKLGVL